MLTLLAGVALAGSDPEQFSSFLSCYHPPGSFLSPLCHQCCPAQGDSLEWAWVGRGLRWSRPLVTFSAGIKPFWLLLIRLPAHSRSLRCCRFQRSAWDRPCAGSMVPRESRHPLCSDSPPFIIPPPTSPLGWEWTPQC